MIKDWISETLIAQGSMTPSGHGRRASVRACPRCHRWTFQGLDSHLMAALAITDLAPLDAFGELVAQTGGLATFNLSYRGDRYELDRRDSYEIAGNPPGARLGVDVVNEHRCGVSIPPTETRMRKRKPRSAEPLGDPPF